MTIASTTAKSGPYLGNGLTTNFDYQFKIFDKSHLMVALHKADGVTQILGEGVDYTVSGVGHESGQIVMNAPPLPGEEVTIIRNVPFVQETDLENQGAFYLEVIETAFDESVMRDQQLKEKLDRAITVPENVSPQAKDKLVADIGRLADDTPEILAAHEFAHQWAMQDEDVAVNDGKHAPGYSAYHWAQKAQVITSFNPDTKLDKTGGTITGDLTVNGALSAPNIYTKTQADAKFLTTANAQFLPLSGGTVTGNVHVNGNFYTPNLAQVGAAGYYNNGNIYGSIWADWHISGFLKEAVDARIEKRAAEWGQAKLNWAVVDTRVVGWVTPQDAQLPSGYFCVGGSYKPGGSGNEDNPTSAKVTFYGRQPQVNIPVIGWRQMGYW